MIPPLLQSRYKTYKEDTDNVATWLANQAQQCGYSAIPLGGSETPQPSGRLKGKARKQAKEAKQTPASQHDRLLLSKPTYTLKIKDFTPLADFIASSSSPAVRVPVSIVTALARAIKLRKQTQSQEGDGDAGHSHFLKVLERTLEILNPRVSSQSSNNSIARSLSQDSSPPLSLGTVDQLPNKFEALKVEEPTQDFLDAPNITTPTGQATIPAAKYQAEPLQDLQEEYLATHCLLQDVSKIRSIVKELWEQYSQGLDLVAISISVNTAINFIKDLEEDFSKRFHSLNGYERPMRVLYAAQCLSLGQNPGLRQRPGDVFNYAVYHIADNLMMPTYSTMLSLSDIVQSDNVPIYKPGHFGIRDRSTAWDQKSARDKVKDDQIVLMEAFSDLSLLALMMEKHPLAEDELIRGIRDMRPGKPVSLWLTFAAQCFLDSQHVLKDELNQAHSQLVRASVIMYKSLTETLEFHKSLRIETWPKENDKFFYEQQRVIKDWIFADMVGEKLQTISARMGTNLPAPEPFRLLKQYPLLCGLFLFALKMRFQEGCIAFADAWGSIMYAAHIYNAARQERLLTSAWKDMELVIVLHSTEAFFTGDRPSGLEEYLGRFMLAMGYSATNLATNRRRQGAKASPRGPKGLKKLCAVAQLFTDRYCDNQHTVAWTVDSLRPIIDSKIDDSEGEDEESDIQKTNAELSSAIMNSQGHNSPKEKSIPKPPKVKTAASGALFRKSKRSTRSIPIADFLSDLVNALNAEAMEMTVDYLLLHRICWTFLRHLNDLCKPQLLKIYGGGYLEKENQLPFTVGYIFMAATGVSKIANLVPKKEGTEVTSKLVVTAAAALKKMIEDGSNEAVTKQLGVLGLPIDFGELDELDELDGPMLS